MWGAGRRERETWVGGIHATNLLVWLERKTRPGSEFVYRGSHGQQLRIEKKGREASYLTAKEDRDVVYTREKARKGALYAKE